MIFVIIAVSLILIYAAVSFIFTLLICKRFSSGFKPMKKLDESLDISLAPYKDVTSAGTIRIKSQPFEEISVTSFDGLELKGSFYENPDAKAILIGFHGYRSGFQRDFAGAFDFYYGLGLNLLLVDQRASGRSGGKYITFGVKESRDAISWCRCVQERFPETPVALAGISLGATTVLMAADGLPDNVRVLLADSAFNDPKDEIKFAAKQNVPGGVILLPGVSFFCRTVCKFGLKQRSASDSLSECDLPVLLAHGEEDRLVSPENINIIKSACKGHVEYITIPGAGHGMGFLVDPAAYKEKITCFLHKFLYGISK